MCLLSSNTFYRVLTVFSLVVVFITSRTATSAPAPAPSAAQTVIAADWSSATSILAHSRSGTIITNNLWWYVFFSREAPPNSVEEFAAARQLPVMMQSDCSEWRSEIVPLLRRCANVTDSFTAWAKTASPEELEEVDRYALRLSLSRAFEQWQVGALARITRENALDEASSTAPRTALETPETRTVQYLLIPRTQLMDDTETSAKVESILARLRAGEDMSKLARDFSAASTARIGGIRENVTRESLPEGTAEAMFTAEVAASPAVVATDYAYFIYRVLSSAKVEGGTGTGPSLREQHATAQSTDRTLAEYASALQKKHEVKLTLPDQVGSNTVIVRWPEGELRSGDVAELFPELWALDRAEAADNAACAAAAWEELLENREDVQQAVDMASAIALRDYLATRQSTTASLEALYATLLKGDDLNETTAMRTWQCRVVVDLPTTATAGDLYYLRQQQPTVAEDVSRQLQKIPMAKRSAAVDQLSLPANFRAVVEDLGFRSDVRTLLSGSPATIDAISKPRQESGQAFAIYWVSEIRPSRILTFEEARPRLEHLARQRDASGGTSRGIRITPGLFPCGAIEDAEISEPTVDSEVSDDDEMTTDTNAEVSVTSGNIQMKVRVRRR